MTVDRQTFSEWLWDILAERKWSQADFARHAGLTKQAVNNYLNKDRIPEKDAMAKISKTLRVPLDTLYEIAGIYSSPKASELDAILMELELIYANASDEKRRDLLRMARYIDSSDYVPQSKSAGKANPITKPRSSEGSA